MDVSFSKPFRDIFKNKKTLAIFSIVCILAYNNMALNYFTKHYMEALKTANGSDFWFMPIIILLSTLLSLVFSGFVLEYMKNEISCAEEVIPSFKNNFKHFLKKGFKLMVATIILWIGFLIAIIVPWIVLNRLFFIPYLWNLLLILSFVFLIILTALFTASYAEKESIKKTFSHFNELFKAFKYATLEIFITFFICIFSFIVYSVIGGLGIFLNYLVIFSVIVYSFISIYNPNLWAQTWKCYKANYKEIQDRKAWLSNPD